MNTHDSILSVFKKGRQSVFAVSYYLASSCMAKMQAHMPYLSHFFFLEMIEIP